MKMTSEGIVRYWLSEPVRHYEPDTFNPNDVPFPDLDRLTQKQRARLKPVLERHPEYLLEIWCDSQVH